MNFIFRRNILVSVKDTIFSIFFEIVEI